MRKARSSESGIQRDGAGGPIGGVVAPAGPRHCVGRACFLRATPSDIAGSREIDSIAKGQPENAEDDVHEEANPGFYTAATGSHSEIEVDGG
jgi:hypothetical protein